MGVLLVTQLGSTVDAVPSLGMFPPFLRYTFHMPSLPTLVSFHHWLFFRIQAFAFIANHRYSSTS